MDTVIHPSKVGVGVMHTCARAFLLNSASKGVLQPHCWYTTSTAYWCLASNLKALRNLLLNETSISVRVYHFLITIFNQTKWLKFGY